MAPTRSSASTRVACALAALAALLGTSCTTVGYIARQARGQLRVLTGRVPITRVLARRDLPAGWRDKLQLVLLTRRWAHDNIGLLRTAAYTEFYDTRGAEVAWNVSAAPKTALRPKLWRFPIVGAVPYLGFFRKRDAIRRARALHSAGYDTLMRPVAAYSSLGFFADPLFSAMLARSRWDLVETVIHEMTHTTIFLRGRVAFNESLAVFIAEHGTLALMVQLLGPLHPDVARVRAAYRRGRQQARLVSDLYRQLTALYRSRAPRAHKLAQRQVLFAAAQARYRRLIPRRNWGSFATRKLNNAVLLSYGRYNRGVEFHARVYQRLGRRLDDLVRLYRRAQDFDDPIATIARRLQLRPPDGPRN